MRAEAGVRFAEWREMPSGREPSKWRWMPVVTALTLLFSALAFCFVTKASPFPILFPFLIFIPLSWIARDAVGMPKQELKYLVDKPSTAFQVPVQISIYQGIFCIGKDEGVMSFAEDWVLYEGLRLSFAIHSDTFAKLDNCLPRLSATYTGSYQLPLTFGDERRKLRVLPYGSFDGKQSDLQRQFAKELNAAKNRRYDGARLETWPPFHTDPLELSRADRGAFGAYLAWEVVVAPVLLLLAILMPELSDFCLVAVVDVIALFIFRIVRLQRLRKLRSPSLTS